MLSKIQNPPIDIQKKLARLCIRENRLEEALNIYMDILRSSPDEPEALKVVGELYLAAGNGQTAEEIFRHAAQLDPKDEAIIKKIEQASNSHNPDFVEEPVPTSPDAVRRLVQNLAHREQPVNEEELTHAAKLLNEIVKSPRPSAEVAKHLDEIDSLLPALLELNIRQAKINGRTDLASGLLNLKTNVTMQKNIFADSSQIPGLNDRADIHPVNQFSGRVVVFHPEKENLGINERVRNLKSTLQAKGILVQDDENAIENADIAIFNNPFLDHDLMGKMALYSAAKIPIILDLDKYFDQSSLVKILEPDGNVNTYSIQRDYSSSLILADLITVASGSLADSLRASGYPVMIIPEGWSIENPYWAEKINNNGVTLQMGWFGTTGNLDDLAVIRRPIIRLLREFEEKLRIVIVGDQDAYRMFDHLPEGSRTFFPCLAKDELPYIISQMDIVLAPSRKTTLNHMRSDEILMYSGIKKIPWAASPIPAALNWERGGLICSTLEEWHSGLRHLILDRDLRHSLGNEGFHIAARREMLVHIQQWYKAFALVQPSPVKTVPETADVMAGEERA